MSFEHIKQQYKVPAEYGREINFKNNRKGVIIRDLGNYIGVNFKDMKPGKFESLHPTWEVEYLGIGKTRKQTRSQKKYQDCIDSEYNGTFGEYLGINN